MAKRSSGLTVEQLAISLTRAFGADISPTMIAKDVEDGAPINPDGTINTILYVAWILKNDNEGK
jgi:hypothetical protein